MVKKFWRCVYSFWQNAWMWQTHTQTDTAWLLKPHLHGITRQNWVLWHAAGYTVNLQQHHSFHHCLRESTALIAFTIASSPVWESTAFRLLVVKIFSDHYNFWSRASLVEQRSWVDRDFREQICFCENALVFGIKRTSMPAALVTWLRCL